MMLKQHNHESAIFNELCFSICCFYITMHKSFVQESSSRFYLSDLLIQGSPIVDLTWLLLAANKMGSLNTCKSF